MLDFRTQTQLIDATAAMMRSCLTATTNTLAASAWRGFSLWGELLNAQREMSAAAPTPAALWPSMANWMVSPQAYGWPAWAWPSPGNGGGMTMAPFARTWMGPSFSLWMPLSDWTPWGRAPWPEWNSWLQVPAAPAAAKTLPGKPAAPEPEPFASYRSFGGHATAQVIMPAEIPAAEIAEVTTAAVLTPIQTMLGVWRAAFGA
jgi:hypothetical protein